MKNETTKLLEDRLAVRPDAPETKTDGGIITPNPQGKGRGTVVACGPGKRITGFAMIAKTTVKPGDTVLYGRFTGGEVTIGGESLLLMRECDVVAIVEEALPIPDIDETDLGLAEGDDNSAVCDCDCGVGPHTKFFHENRGESAPEMKDTDENDTAAREFTERSKRMKSAVSDDGHCPGCRRAKTEDKNAFAAPDCPCGKVDKTEYPDCKTMYDACCGADCDCTPVDGDGNEDKTVPGFCVRHRSFTCGCKDGYREPNAPFDVAHNPPVRKPDGPLGGNEKTDEAASLADIDFDKMDGTDIDDSLMREIARAAEDRVIHETSDEDGREKPAADDLDEETP